MLKYAVSETKYLHALHSTSFKHVEVSHGWAWRYVASLRIRKRSGRGITVEIRRTQSGLVVYTGKPHLQRPYISIML